MLLLPPSGSERKRYFFSSNVPVVAESRGVSRCRAHEKTIYGSCHTGKLFYMFCMVFSSQFYYASLFMHSTYQLERKIENCLFSTTRHFGAGRASMSDTEIR